jgi:hypothetical protein
MPFIHNLIILYKTFAMGLGCGASSWQPVVGVEIEEGLHALSGSRF